jgi:hypothetical protein
VARSPDGRRFYLSHRQRREVFAYAFDTTSGRLGVRDLFVQPPNLLVCPMARPSVLVCLARRQPIAGGTVTGAVDRDIALPVSRPTMCAFAGDALELLYATSASDELSLEQGSARRLRGHCCAFGPTRRASSGPACCAEPQAPSDSARCFSVDLRRQTVSVPEGRRYDRGLLKQPERSRAQLGTAEFRHAVRNASATGRSSSFRKVCSFSCLVIGLDGSSGEPF